MSGARAEPAPDTMARPRPPRGIIDAASVSLSAASVQEADGSAEQLVHLRCPLERQDRQRQVELLPGDRLRSGELLQPVLAVDATEAAVTRATERQRRDPGKCRDLVDA